MQYASETVRWTVSEDRLNTGNMSLVGENSCFPPHPFSALLRLAVLTHGVTARQRAECEGFALTLPLPFVSKRKRKPIADAVFNMRSLNYRLSK